MQLPSKFFDPDADYGWDSSRENIIMDETFL